MRFGCLERVEKGILEHASRKWQNHRGEETFDRMAQNVPTVSMGRFHSFDPIDLADLPGFTVCVR